MTSTLSSSSSLGDPNCPICGGKGFYSKDVSVGHPDFGKALPCSCSTPRLKEARQRQMNALGSSEMLAEMTFDSFLPEGIALTPERQKNLRDAFEAARHFAMDPHGWLLLQGGFGVGKTHLAAAIANTVNERGGDVLFVLVPDLLDHLRSGFDPKSIESYGELFDRLKNTPLLVLDDLGAESPTPWAQEKLFQLLDHRYLLRLPTVITTNKPIEAIEARIRSRLVDHQLVVRRHILAIDYRGGGYIDHLVELSELDLHADQTFESFQIPRSGREEFRQNLLTVRSSAWEYAQRPVGWIAFVGKSGMGKTHLAAAIANHARLNQPQLLFISIPRLLDHLRASFAPTSTVPYDVRFEQIKTAPLLVLDDLRGQSTSLWAEEKLFQLVDYRYLTRKPTVFTIFSPDEAMKELTSSAPRIASRLEDISLCKLCFLKDSGRPRSRQRELDG